MIVSDTATLIRSTFFVLGVLVNGFHLTPLSESESDTDLIPIRIISQSSNVPSWSSKESITIATRTSPRAYIDTSRRANTLYPEEKSHFAHPNVSYEKSSGSDTPELYECVKTVCYDDSVGCFEPWTLSLAYGFLYYSVCPEDPETVGTSFHVFYQKNPYESEDASRIGPEDKIAFVVHGYGNSYNTTRMLDLKNSLLNVVDVVVSVDYTRGGAPGIPSRTGLDDFFQAAVNIQVVGRQIANYVHSLREMNQVDPETIHFVGYSLGSHALHFAAEHAKGKDIKFGRITGEP